MRAKRARLVAAWACGDDDAEAVSEAPEDPRTGRAAADSGARDPSNGRAGVHRTPHRNGRLSESGPFPVAWGETSAARNGDATPELAPAERRPLSARLWIPAFAVLVLLGPLLAGAGYAGATGLRGGADARRAPGLPRGAETRVRGRGDLVRRGPLLDARPVRLVARGRAERVHDLHARGPRAVPLDLGARVGAGRARAGSRAARGGGAGRGLPGVPLDRLRRGPARGRARGRRPTSR